jgi:hypothetical protein
MIYYNIIFPHVDGKPAIDRAREQYCKYMTDYDPKWFKKIVGTLRFWRDCYDYFRNGFVCIRPNLFAMVKVVQFEGERIWHIQIAVGDLMELLAVLPFYLPKICFCRNNNVDQMRVVRTEYLAKVAMQQYNKTRSNIVQIRKAA